MSDFLKRKQQELCKYYDVKNISEVLKAQKKILNEENDPTLQKFEQ